MRNECIAHVYFLPSGVELAHAAGTELLDEVNSKIRM
jgi:hypothetical protein